jgi:hypothetical protein
MVSRTTLQEDILQKLDTNLILTLTATRASGKTSLVLSLRDRNLIFV